MIGLEREGERRAREGEGEREAAREGRGVDRGIAGRSETIFAV